MCFAYNFIHDSYRDCVSRIIYQKHNWRISSPLEWSGSKINVLHLGIPNRKAIICCCEEFTSDEWKRLVQRRVLECGPQSTLPRRRDWGPESSLYRLLFSYRWLYNFSWKRSSQSNYGHQTEDFPTCESLFRKGWSLRFEASVRLSSCFSGVLFPVK